jgi:tRNA-dihydrouridine synthase B
MSDCNLSRALKIGGVEVPGQVWIAPMTGVSDLPFRRVASRLGASYVATEMVACAQFAEARPDVVRRAAMGEGLPLMVVQLVGREPEWIEAGARLAVAAGAQIIDLNFGCPAKEVTGALSGSALMRDLDLSRRLIEAAVKAVDIPVTVKMRLGWDDASRNAPELAQAAERVGAAAVTVHGRTRQQFYRGEADWAAVKAVKTAVSVPVLVNGDIIDPVSAQRALALSGADGVMIGRGATGRPWVATQIQAALDGRSWAAPEGEVLLAIVMDHLQSSLSFYGERLGVRIFRKHLAAYIDAAPAAMTEAERRAARSRLCRLEDPRDICSGLQRIWAAPAQRLAA